ncbi:MAG: HAMP domain-containing histidine kinase [Treponema sp.]|nr:HAMP domain-containing histidine kinase [Treponema sp.]
MDGKGLAITYGVMLFLVGIQSGLLIWPVFIALPNIAKIVVIMGYWAVVALALVLLVNWQIKQYYDRPVRKLSMVSKKVAEGNFLVHLEPRHSADEYDFIDVMYTDFNTMVQELGSIETLKNDFISNVSHEIKTPLAIMQNYASALRNLNITPEQRLEYTETIISATDRLNNLVSNILKLNKLENQKIIPSMEEYDLCGQLTECALSFENLLDAKNLAFNVEMDDRALIRADKSMLEIVWNNLLTNAIKFTEPGGTISLAQTSDENTVTVTISDTGCGMSESTLKHIFDKFYQGDTSHSQEGNGLGLALAFRVVELLGGKISVESSPGRGSAFSVCLNTAA